MKFKKKKHNFTFVFKNKEEAKCVMKILKTMLKVMQINAKRIEDVSYFANIVSDYEKQINASKRKIVLSIKEEYIDAFMEFVDCYEWPQCKRRNYEI